MSISAKGSDTDFPGPSAEEKELTRIAIELAKEQLAAIREASGLQGALEPFQLQQLGLTETTPAPTPNPEFAKIEQQFAKTPPFITQSREVRIGRETRLENVEVPNPEFARLESLLKRTPKIIGEPRSIEATPETEQLLDLEERLRLQEAERGLETGARNELREIQLETLRAGGAATDEDIRLIQEARGAALQRGESDIDRAQRESTEILREELAPQLGLRPSDSPILDRGARIAEEATRQKGRLVNTLDAQAAEAQLRFPVERQALVSEATRRGQEFEESVAQFQQQLREQAAINRLSLTAGQSAPGLNLAQISGSNVGSIAAATTERGPSSSSFGFGFGLGQSSSG